MFKAAFRSIAVAALAALALAPPLCEARHGRGAAPSAVSSPSITTTSPLSSAAVGVSYSTTIAATGGTPPYTWSITSNTPNTGSWSSINSSTGAISGTPGTAETETIAVKVTDSVSNTGTKTFTLVVNSTGSGAPTIKVNGNLLVNTAGATQQLYGMNMTGLEYLGAQNSGSVSTWGGTIPNWSVAAGFTASGNGVARIPLNSASWLGQSCYYSLTNTAVTFTSATTTSGGTLNANWALPTGPYPIQLNGNSTPYTMGNFTNGSPTVTWNTLSGSSGYTSANVVSFGSSRTADPQGNYQLTVETAVQAAQAQGMRVILDLHWDAPTVTMGTTTGCLMPLGQGVFDDANGLAFWTSLAGVFGTQASPALSGINNAAIMFELFNEPELDSWDYGFYSAANQGGSSVSSTNCLLSGCWTTSFVNWIGGSPQNYKLGFNYQLYGFQALLNAIRGVGADNILLVEGNSYAQIMSTYASWVPTDTLTPSQVAVAWHPYPNQYNTTNPYPYTAYGPEPKVASDNGYAQPQPSDVQWANAVTVHYPVIYTEFGDATSGTAASHTPASPPDQLLLHLAATNPSYSAIGWEFNDTRTYQFVGSNIGSGGAPFFSWYTNSGNTVIGPILGNGTVFQKWASYDLTPLDIISRRGWYGQATAGTTTTLTDSLQDWVVNQWAGSTIYDSATGDNSAVASNTAQTLTFATLGAAPNAGDGYAILTSQMIPQVTSGGYAASLFTAPSTGGTDWNGPALPNQIAFDISSLTAKGTTTILWDWWNDGTYNFDPNHNVADTSVTYNLPGTYTFDCNSAAGGGSAPTSGWTNLVTVTGNYFKENEYNLPVTGCNWIRMEITAMAPSNSNNNPSLKADLYDVTNNSQMNVALMGDSITANGMSHDSTSAVPRDAIGNTGAGTLIHNTNSYGSPGYFNQLPFPYMNMGQAGMTTTQYLAWYNSYNPLSVFTGKVVSIALGTNDLPTAPASTLYTSNMTTLIQDLQGLGYIVMVPTMPYCNDSQHQGSAAGTGFPVYWPLENNIQALSGVVAGPNFRQIFYGMIGASNPSGSSGFTAVTNSSGTTTATDTTQTWSANVGGVHAGHIINDLTTHTTATITSNTTNTLTYPTPSTAPSIGDVYNITWQNYTATGGSTTTLVDTSQNWPVNALVYTIVADVNTGDYALITSNTSNTVTFAAMGTAVSSGDVYSLNGQNMVTSTTVAAWGDSPSDNLHPGYNGRHAQRIWYSDALTNLAVSH